MDHFMESGAIQNGLDIAQGAGDKFDADAAAKLLAAVDHEASETGSLSESAHLKEGGLHGETFEGKATEHDAGRDHEGKEKNEGKYPYGMGMGGMGMGGMGGMGMGPGMGMGMGPGMGMGMGP